MITPVYDDPAVSVIVIDALIDVTASACALYCPTSSCLLAVNNRMGARAGFVAAVSFIAHPPTNTTPKIIVRNSGDTRASLVRKENFREPALNRVASTK